MPWSHNRKLVCVIICCLLEMACSAGGTSSLPGSATRSRPDIPIVPERILSSSQCNFGAKPLISWIRSPRQMDTALERINQHMVGAPKANTPNLNYLTEAAVLITMGQQRSGGYTLNINDNSLRLEENTAVLTVEWREPRPGMLQAQVLTSPCLLVRVPLAGYDRLRVETDRGKVIGSIGVK